MSYSAFRINKGRFDKNLHKCRASHVGHTLQDTIKTHMWIRTLWVRYSYRLEIKAVAYVSERVSLPELIFTHGPQDQTYSAYRYPQHHRHRVQHKKECATAKEEGERENIQLWKPIEESFL